MGGSSLSAEGLRFAEAFQYFSGVVLLSHTRVCSIMGDEELDYRVRNGIGYTLFSMDTREIPALRDRACTSLYPRSKLAFRPASKRLPRRLLNIIDREGEVEWKQASRAISIGQLNASRRLRLRPIDQVVYLGPSGLASGSTYLKAGFPLRCFQRLSLPHIATLPCRWRDNRFTRGVSIPVLSY